MLVLNFFSSRVSSKRFLKINILCPVQKNFVLLFVFCLFIFCKKSCFLIMYSRKECTFCLPKFYFSKRSQKGQRQSRGETPELQASGTFKSQHDIHDLNFVKLNLSTVIDAWEIENFASTLFNIHPEPPLSPPHFCS